MSASACLVVEKACHKCGKTYPLTPEYFHKHAHYKDGLRKDCKPCVRKAKSDWYAANKDKARAYDLYYAIAHKEKRAQIMRNYRENNRERFRAADQRRRCRKRGASGAHTAADIKAIFKAQREKCPSCRASIADGYHVDHIVPLAKGGGNGKDNIQLLCPPCNRRKHVTDQVKFMQAQGYLL